jgi:hypothetical protein
MRRYWKTGPTLRPRLDTIHAALGSAVVATLAPMLVLVLCFLVMILSGLLDID